MNYKVAEDNQTIGLVVSEQPVPVHVTDREAVSTRPLPNRWKDSICDWPKNLFPSCYCVLFGCYGMWLLAQSKFTSLYLNCSDAYCSHSNHLQCLTRSDFPLFSALFGHTVLSGSWV